MTNEKYIIRLNSAVGNDRNDGVTAPVKSLRRACDLLYTLDAPYHVEVQLAPGEYPVSEMIQLFAEAMDNKPLSLSFIGDNAVIKGTYPISNEGFTRVEGKPYYSYQFEKTNDTYPVFRYLYVNGKAQTIAYHGFLHAYDARKENVPQFKIAFPFAGVDKTTEPLSKDYCEKNGYKLYVPEEATDLLPDGEILDKVEFHTPIAWYYRVMHLLKVDKSDRRDGHVAIYFRPQEMRQWEAMHGFAGHFFFLQNSLSFLNKPGQFYYDDKNGTLYYYPENEAELKTAKFELPMTEHMLALFGLHNVTFRGITFTGNDNRTFDRGYYHGCQATTADGAFGTQSLSALYVRDTKNFTLTDCTFTDIATTAVKFFGIIQNLTITDNRFLRIGMSAIDIGARLKSEGEAIGSYNLPMDQFHNQLVEGSGGFYHKIENVKVLRNLIDDVASVTRGSIAFYMSIGKEVEIAYNTIRNSAYTGISVGWHWDEVTWKFGEKWHLYHVDIHHNFLSGFMSGQADGGAIYTLGGNVENGYHEHFNYVHDNFVWYSDTCWDGQGIVMPYYHDGASSNWHTYNNTLLLYPERRVTASFYLQNLIVQLTHNILVEDNDVVCPYGDHYTYADHTKDWTDHTKFKCNKDFDAQTLESKMFGNSNCSPVNEKGEYITRVDADRFLYQRNNRLFDNPVEFPADVIARCASAGAPGANPDMSTILSEMQAVYDDYYARAATKE